VVQTKEHLIQLITQINDPKKSDDEVSYLLDFLIKETGCPHVGDYIFYSDPELSVEEVVEKAISYQPIQL